MAHFFVITNTLSGSLIYYHSHLSKETKEFDIMGPLSRPRSKILRVAVSRIILSSEASKVKLVGNLVA